MDELCDTLNRDFPQLSAYGSALQRSVNAGDPIAVAKTVARLTERAMECNDDNLMKKVRSISSLIRTCPAKPQTMDGLFAPLPFRVVPYQPTLAEQLEMAELTPLPCKRRDLAEEQKKDLSSSLLQPPRNLLPDNLAAQLAQLHGQVRADSLRLWRASGLMGQSTLQHDMQTLKNQVADLQTRFEALNRISEVVSSVSPERL